MRSSEFEHSNRKWSVVRKKCSAFDKRRERGDDFQLSGGRRDQSERTIALLHRGSHDALARYQVGQFVPGAVLRGMGGGSATVR